MKENDVKYKKLMSPLVIRGHILKNRLEASNSLPHFLQGPEAYPADTVIAHYENKAKSAAIVTCMGINNGTRGKQLPMFVDFGHFPDFDLYDPSCQNYLLQLADAIHYYQSIACMVLFAGPPSQYPLLKYKKKSTKTKADDVYDTLEEKGLINDGPFMDEFTIEEIPAHLAPEQYTGEMLDKVAESLAEQAFLISKLDFDMVTVHMSYRGSLAPMLFSPLTNHRTDEWGGSYENRKRFPLMVLARIRQRVGEKIIIELQWTADESNIGGYGVNDSVQFLNEAKAYVDIVQIRASEVDPAHPTGFNPLETPFVEQAAYIKKNVPGLLVSTIGGNFYPDTCEKIIAEGKADIIGAARAYISNPEYGRLIQMGHGDDIVPCLRCNKCHGRGVDDPFQSVCSVNPVIGLEQKIARMIMPVKRRKRAAIIGGGPAGMRCAMYLQDRGHIPVIYESEDALGGAIRHADHAKFKWPLRDFKDYLIYQIEKRKIDVQLHTAATPEMIREGKYDVVVAAIGAKPVVLPFVGIDKIRPFFAQEAFVYPDRMGKDVVIIGGGDVGVEVGIYLSQKNHHVTVVEMRERLVADTTVMHYLSVLKAVWEAEENFHSVTSAKVTLVSENEVRYRDANEKEYSLKADNIVLCTGMNACCEQAIRFYGCAPEFYMVGDCEQTSTIQHAMRSAFSVANRI